MTELERRKHRRLEIRLPLECSNLGGAPDVRYRTVTLNVSTGGVYFETEATEVEPGVMLKMELTVPPGDGHYPYQGRVTGLGEIVRVVPLKPKIDTAGQARSWVGVATQFRESLKLSF